MVKIIFNFALILVFIGLFQSDSPLLWNSSHSDGIDNLERSWEVRWFFKGKIPDEVKSWFFTEEDLGDPISDSDFEAREDLYLVCSNGVFLSPKLRAGKLEVKYREDSKDITDPYGVLLGKGEYWRKWSWRYLEEDEITNGDSDPFGSNFLKKTDKDLRVKVEKKRWRRKFGVSETGLEPVPWSKTDLPHGLLTELTAITINADIYWTLALEVFGAASHPMHILQQGVTRLIEKFPGPGLQVKNSYSYPEWLFFYLKSRT